jgi:hypothetical protein
MIFDAMDEEEKDEKDQDALYESEKDSQASGISGLDLEVVGSGKKS